MRTNKILLILFIIFSGFAIAEAEYAIFDAGTGEIIDLGELANRVSAYDVCFFGEFHDDLLLHQLEVGFLSLLDNHTDKLAVSMEMFERDVQDLLDAYLTGEIDESEFLEKSRPWGNYETGYKALVEYSKQNGLPVIAANIPRKYASLLRKEGWEAIENLSGEERHFIAAELVVQDDEYKERFIEVMTANMDTHAAMPGDMLDIEGFYRAQCIKDDTMAESILNFKQQYPGYKIIHFNGDFHSNSHLGSVQKLGLMKPELKIAVITPVLFHKDKEIEFPEDRRGEGDFLIVLKYED